ncbi:MAG: hypothetical protein RBS39_00345 [Phycisphaerales bacterium]|nr:hypothetical protein [Phycisphaerales bacterium]
MRDFSSSHRTARTPRAFEALDRLEPRVLLSDAPFDFAGITLDYAGGANAWQVEVLEGSYSGGVVTGTTREAGGGGPDNSPDAFNATRFRSLGSGRFSLLGPNGAPLDAYVNGASFLQGRGYSAGFLLSGDDPDDDSADPADITFLLQRPSNATIADLTGTWSYRAIVAPTSGDELAAYSGSINIGNGQAVFFATSPGELPIARSAAFTGSNAQGRFTSTNLNGNTDWFYLSKDGSMLLHAELDTTDGRVAIGIAFRADTTPAAQDLVGQYRFVFAGSSDGGWLELQSNGVFALAGLKGYDAGSDDIDSTGTWSISGSTLTLTRAGTGQTIVLSIADNGNALLAQSISGSNVMGLAVKTSATDLAPATALVVGSGSIGDDGSPLVYELRDDNVWYVLDLVDAAGSNDPDADPADSIATWTDAVDGTFFAAVTTGDRVYLYERNSSDATWSIRNLTGELTGSRGIVSNVVILQRSTGDTDIAGLDSDGDLIVYSAKPSANNTWTFTDLADTFLRPNGRTMPAFTGPLVSYTTSWNARTIAGLNAAGQLEAVWTAQNLDTWLTSNLSNITGAPTLAGGLSVFLTSWNAINIVGLNAAGNVIVSWWVPSFGGAWRQNNFTTQFGAQPFAGTEVTTWVTPWRALNIAGLDAQGNVNVFWWVPGGTWNVANLTQNLPMSQARPQSSLSSATGLDQSLNIFGVDDDTGDTIRLFWKPNSNWSLENLTDIALPG